MVRRGLWMIGLLLVLAVVACGNAAGSKVGMGCSGDCEAKTLKLTQNLHRTACPMQPLPLVVNLAAPANWPGLQVRGTAPPGRSEPLACAADSAGGCRYLLPLAEAGTYLLVVEGLPEDGRMSLVDGVVQYTYTPFALRLAQGARERQIAGEGASQVTISVPVSMDEVNCPLAELDAMTVTLSPDRRLEAEEVSVALLGGLRITDLGADECQVQPQLSSIVYDLIVPAGTAVADVNVLYWSGTEWASAECQFQDEALRCTAMLPNPLIGQPYAVKAVVGGEEFVSMQMPFDNLCYLFTGSSVEN